MNLIWMRTSLRVLDNPLWHQAATSGQVPQDIHLILTPVPEQWRQHGYGQRKIRALHQQHDDLAQWARRHGLQLHWLPCETYREAATRVLDLTRDLQADALWADREYGLNERRRDAWLGKRLNADRIDLNLVDDRLTYAPESLLTQQRQPFQVFSAFRRAWRQRWQADPRAPFARPHWVQDLPPSEQSAIDALQQYVDSQLIAYDDERNDLSRPVVSGLAPWAANGLLTTRQACAEAAAARLEADTWLSQWIWREFFYAVGFHFPDVYRHRPLQAWTDAVAWMHNDAHLQAWQDGRTGYPVVDAAMRQLRATGQMPNRARMFTAAFLAKDLRLDWRKGEAWFLDQLLDADFAVNNGNWQWGASTGVDAAPYFRIFNPQRQAERFDPDGDYIRTWVPELAHLQGKQILNPDSQARQQAGYPPPLVIHREAAERTKTAFKAAKDHASTYQVKA
ncbi:deoxyribodipyrimidine photo-lyase [Natronospirillum operosum]|uniref:Deoxyribodipyrimidine photo-lyase n=1 Tax=Natronospirillum operosum TaxID=2759953 RepID=A0A4Z0WIR7_9GAMM|nr:FAD-binding domain-containing protein [Natronospirillum operosum]TGG95541.1 deoxyribodipyrimidine photo-lyase [Natronospirillum operosum]